MSEQVIGFNFRIPSDDGGEISGIELVLTEDELIYRDSDGNTYDRPELLGGNFLVRPFVVAQIFAQHRPLS